MSAVEAPEGRRGAVVVLTLLFVSGWAANHFAAMIPVLKESHGFTTGMLDGAFGVYALGLLPGLLGGGGVSDRLGRRPVVLVGALVAGLGNLAMAAWLTAPVIVASRLVVGVGVGLAMSAGTAWAADLGGKRGTTLAGTILTAGFAVGPLVTGLLATFSPGTASWLPFVVTAAFSVVAFGLGLRGRGSPAAAASTTPARDGGPRGLSIALAASIPMALWVFASVTVSIVTLAARMQARFHGPWVPGMAAAVTLGTGVLVQMLARRAAWGPYAGVAGAAFAAAGYLLTAFAGHAPTLPWFLFCSVVLGTAYGLCLREGLTDVESLAPVATRGIAIGVFYVCTYVGFALPVVLEVIEPTVGIVAPFLVLAGLAALAAVVRAVHIRTTEHLARG